MFHLFKSRWFERFCILVVVFGFYAYKQYLVNEGPISHAETDYFVNTKHIDNECVRPIAENVELQVFRNGSSKKPGRWKVDEPTKYAPVTNIGEYIDVDSITDKSETGVVVDIGEFIDVDDVYSSHKNEKRIDIGPPLDVERVR